MNDTIIELTKKGLVEAKNELQTKIEMRTKIADEIDKARQQGDLSENAAYHAALADQELNENKIVELEELIGNAVVVESSASDGVGMGNTVHAQNLSTDKLMEFHMVGPSEANPAEHKISIDSPLGKALKNRKKGDLVIVESPAGEIKYKIVEIK